MSHKHKFKKVLHKLSDLQINRAFKNDKLFGGVYSRDDLPNKIERKSYIINMDSVNGNGTHWICVSNLPHNMIVYFDPFGCPPPEEVLTFMRIAKKPMYYSDVDIQDINSDACGWFCIYVIKQLEKGRHFLDILLNDFKKNTFTNEKIITAFGEGLIS